MLVGTLLIKLSFAMFALHKPDAERLKAHWVCSGQKSRAEVDDLWETDRRCFYKSVHVRKLVRPPAELAEQLTAVMAWVQDTNETAYPLPVDELMDVHRRQLTLAHRGLISGALWLPTCIP
jgi:hypothetical protein